MQGVAASLSELGVVIDECSASSETLATAASVRVSAGIVELTSPAVCVVKPLVALQGHGFVSRTGRESVVTVWRASGDLAYVIDDVSLLSKCRSLAIEKVREEIRRKLAKIKPGSGLESRNGK
jgi:hypothetical protein